MGSKQAFWLALTTAVGLAGGADAHHGHAPVVVEDGAFRFEAPNTGGAAVVNVTNTQTKAKLWSVIVYRSVVKPPLEEDVQWIFIVDMKIADRDLVITDERKRKFAVNLATHAVRSLPK